MRQNVILTIRGAGSGRIFRFYGRRGGEFIFTRQDDSNTHRLEIPIDQWRANDFHLAHNLLDQPLAVPILFDISDPDGAVVEQVGPGETVEIDVLQKANTDLAARLEEAEKHLEENGKLLKASAARIKDLLAEKSTPAAPQSDPEANGSPNEDSDSDPGKPPGPNMTESEAGAILGNGISEPADSEAAKVLAEAKNTSASAPKALTKGQKAAATRAANKAKKATQNTEAPPAGE